ncbi:hypothetical protein ACFO5R_00020 [Halosolutus amylolyticus]|uniref:Uncharacterized protein n=1 Tax=Halosolutus amylolyticus TaxID=2932267 RepID=A0ABD5PIM4_9EURY
MYGQNPIEDDFGLNFILGFEVLFSMAFVGQAIGMLLLELGVPYARWIDASIEIIVVFVAFVVLYRLLCRIASRRRRNLVICVESEAAECCEF